MSAHTIIDNAPIGSIVTWSDGTPQPPTRFRKKLASWQTSNSRGRLIRKQGGRSAGYPHAVLDQVTADEVGANAVEGRAA